MSKRVLAGRIAVVGLLLLAVVTIPSAQVPAGQPQAAGIPELLVEVRALRAELNQLGGASMRMQLLVARLTLQEQRITTLTRQIAEVQGPLAAVTSERAEAQKQVGALEAAVASGTLPPEEERMGKSHLRALAEALSVATADEQQLRARENELLAAVSSEQARWTDLSSRLDDLERALPAGSR